MKTNAVRIIESRNIEHTLHSYEVDEDDLSGVTVAKKIGAEPDEVFKTLVAEGDKNGINVFCIPVTAELNLKKAAAVSGNKKIEMIKAKDLLSVTGYIRGGCSPIGMKKNFPVFLEETAEIFDKIYISAGTRGMQVKIASEELVKLTGAKYSDLL